MRILLVFDPGRKDLFSYLSKDTFNEYYLIFNDTPSKLDPSLSFIKFEYGWSEFSNPYQIIKKISPDKIVFQEVFDLKQIALQIAAKSVGVPTSFLDHGIWSQYYEILREDSRLQTKVRRDKFKKLKNLKRVIIGYFFYYSVFRAVKLKHQIHFLMYPFYSFLKSGVKAVNKLPFDERIPNNFILFAKYNLEPLQSYYHFSANKVLYSGFPFFDSMFLETKIERGYIVFIDHPYLEDNLLEWTVSYHQKLAKTLEGLAEKSGKKIFVKLHPRSDLKIWEEYKLSSEKIAFIKGTVDNDLYLYADLIVGYASTLMIGFISAKKNVVLVGWHPEPGIFGPDYSVYGVCHKSLDIDKAQHDYEYWEAHNCCEDNIKNYQNFVELFNYPFDGKATQRVIDAIMENEIS